MASTPAAQQHEERWALLVRIEEFLNGPLTVLGFAWVCVVVATFVWPAQTWLQTLSLAIWCAFVADFVIRFILAPHKLGYLRANVLLVASLLLPALAMLRVVGVLALVPAWQAPLLRLISSVHRSMRVLGGTMQRRGLPYVLVLTALVTVAGAAGMLRFESRAPGSDVTTYPAALWWTAMVMTTLGSDYFPHTAPGRILCLLLAIFAFSVFGYITAAISSYFINRDAGDQRSDIPDANQLRALLDEVRALRAEVRSLGGNQPRS
ncbi:MAG: potassium channel family protein [Candidatus Eremiobacteraeota bacterium]|nr:potassium channel family protein [Candidatus Eremiobacteraeota bacterium]